MGKRGKKPKSQKCWRKFHTGVKFRTCAKFSHSGAKFSHSGAKILHPTTVLLSLLFFCSIFPYFDFKSVKLVLTRMLRFWIDSTN